MKTLNKPAESLAGNLELFITPTTNIDEQVFQNNIVVDETLLLKIICMRETLSHTVRATKTAAGVKYSHKITAQVYGQSEENDELLNQFCRYKLLAVIKSTTGNYYMVGTRDIGLNLEFEYDSGADASAAKGYKLTLTGDLPGNTTALRGEWYPL